MPDTPLTEDHISFLSEFLNPVYLQPRTMKALAARFVEESSLELHSFLCGPLADKLENGLREVDTSDGLNKSRNGRIPSHDAGTSSGAWTIKTPPHKWRYCVLKPHIYGPPEEFSPQVPQAASDEVIRSLQDELFTSNAFRAWLSVVSRLLPLRYTVEGRRFRPGLDYTLATSEEQEARLDVVLDLTPDIANSSNGDGRVPNREDGVRGWQIGEWGGWEVCCRTSLKEYNLIQFIYSVIWHLMTKRMIQPSTDLGHIKSNRQMANKIANHLMLTVSHLGKKTKIWKM